MKASFVHHIFDVQPSFCPTYSVFYISNQKKCLINKLWSGKDKIWITSHKTLGKATVSLCGGNPWLNHRVIISTYFVELFTLICAEMFWKCRALPTTKRCIPANLSVFDSDVVEIETQKVKTGLKDYTCDSLYTLKYVYI